MKKIFQSLVAVIGSFLSAALMGPQITRRRTADVAFPYRMSSGFPGDVNRFHPASILPGLANTTNPPAAYGGPVIVNTADSTIRGIIAADGSATPGPVFGFLVRPFPIQQQSGGMAAAIGTATPPTTGVIDVLREGYVMAKLPAGSTVTKYGTVYVWAAVSAGNHVQGQLEPSANGTNTLTINNAYFLGPADANGNVEIEIRAA